MSLILKDVDETLDYIFHRASTDKILSFVVSQSAGATVVINSSYINSTTVTDSDGNVYPVGSCIVIWLTGGTANSVESLKLNYTTEQGRTLDEVFTVKCVKNVI